MGRLIIVLGIVFTMLCACNLKAPLPLHSEESYDCRRIKVAPGPEDFVLDRWHGSPRLLVSCHDRRHPETPGGIYSFNIDSEEFKELPRIGEPADIAVFKPHGVDIRRDGNDILLYVIIHDPHNREQRSENAVAIYLVGRDELKFIKLLEDKRYLWSPNDLSVLPSGEIYLTNDYHGSFDLYFKRKASEVVYFNPETQKWSKVADDIGLANGILAEKSRVFVAAMFDNQILEYPRLEDGSLGKGRAVAFFKGPDNIMKSGKYLMVAAHFDDLALMKTKKDPSAHAPSVIFRIDPEQMARSTVFMDNGGLISAASTALVYNNRLYISDVFDPYMVVCKVPKFLF